MQVQLWVGELRTCTVIDLKARESLADVYEHLEHAAQSGAWRNFYLKTANEEQGKQYTASAYRHHLSTHTQGALYIYIAQRA